MHSIHALRSTSIPRSSSSPYLPTTRFRRRELPSPHSTEWRSWRLHECILFLADYPPPAKSPLPCSAGATTSSPPLPFSSQERTHLTQLSTFVREETRRGREYGRGDWDQACNGVKVLFPELEDVISKAVIDVFEGGLV
ncbi:hypothetical protein BS47DRAFT_895991 [Hydnum rufescens UP504]|uniref:Uncharacterized protein n=1 Tax=Hydnum rufescens UP504 TaxID=1448309 RepID=A0A9P6AYF7_9AGAM|nr:hypothetical protein BS47DRAFT_895991 [Hydnum rufescens UP504]